MRDTDVLTKAIEKANKNGFGNYEGWEHFQVVMGGVGLWDGSEKNFVTALEPHKRLVSDRDIIFCHDFCKSFWGEEPELQINTNVRPEDLRPLVGQVVISWRYHLQQMVLEENPVQYLSKFI